MTVMTSTQDVEPFSGVTRCNRCGTACAVCHAALARQERGELRVRQRAEWLLLREQERAATTERLERARMLRETRRQEKAERAAELDRELLELRLSGRTLDEIGALYGYTRERVRQRIDRVAPWAAAEARRLRSDAIAQRRLERKKATEQVHEQLIEEQGIPCVTCGSPMLNRYHGEFAACSKDCRRLFLALRNHFGAPALNGPNGERLYIRPGSTADTAALEAHQRGLRIFGLLPEAIQKQISGESPRVPSYHHLRGPVAKPEPHPCQKCGKATTNKRWCSKQCWSTRGPMKAPS